MQPGRIIIATITLARNEAEETELKESLETLVSLNIPVVVADGGSTPYFLSFLDTLPGVTVLPNKTGGVWPQAKASVKAAAQMDKPFIFYTEPDKKEFFKSGLMQMIAQIETRQTTGVVLASRSEEAFASFPTFQQRTEATINSCCEEVTGLQTDFCYGPFLLTKNLAPYLDLVNEDIGWGWRPYVFGVAHRLNYDLHPITGDFFCPQQQRADNPKERIYRMKQLEQNIRGLVLSTNVSLEKTQG